MNASPDAFDPGVGQLLVVADDNGAGTRLVSQLRNAGLALRPTLAGSLPQLSTLLTQAPWDLLLLSDSTALGLAEVLALLRKHQQQLPLVLIRDHATPDTELQPLFRQGVSAVVPLAAPERLATELTREIRLATVQRKLRQRERQLQELELRHRQLLDDNPLALSYVRDGIHLYCNAAHARLFGYPDVATISTTPLLNLVSPATRGELKSLLAEAEAAPRSAQLAARLYDGRAKELRFSFCPVAWQGSPCLQLTVQPGAGNAALAAEAQRLARQDLLTGLDAREHFLQRLEDAIRAAVQQAQFSSLILVRLDDFGEIAAALGRSSSNLVLNDIAQTLQRGLSQPLQVGRLDEHLFGLLLPEADPDRALALCDEIRDRINNRVSSAMLPSLTLACSAGMTLINGHALNAAALLERAQLNLQLKPQAAVPAAAFHIDGELQPAASDMLSYLQQALAQRRFTLLFQPVVGLNGNAEPCYEILLRMLDAEGNEIRPGAFLPLANLHGLGEEIDRMVVTMAIDILLARPDISRLMINITENSLLSPAFLPWLSTELTRRRLPAERLMADIDASSLQSSPDQALAFCQGLAVLGLPVNIARFGGAPESSMLLERLTPAVVTLDETLVRNLAYSAHRKANVQSLVRSLHARDIRVLTPRIEDMAVLPVLWEIGVDYAQGYCLQAPSQYMNYEFAQEQELTLSAPPH